MNERSSGTLGPRTRIFIIACAGVGSLIGVLSANTSVRLEFWKIFAPDKFLDVTAKQLNERLPMTVDEFTRWDHAVALPSLTLKYCYTVSGIEMDADSFTKTMMPMLIENYRNHDGMKSLRQIGATLVYDYSDSEGDHILQLTITPDML